MEDSFKVMSFCNLLHDDHKHHVLIYSLGSLAEDRSTFELVGSNLVMSGLKKDTELICLGLEILHERAYP